MVKNKEAREELRKWLVKHTMCSIQEGRGDKPYPCGTCAIQLLTDIGLNSNEPDYLLHNEENDRDRHNEVWRAILQIRDAR